VFLFKKKSNLKLITLYKEVERVEFKGDNKDTKIKELLEKERKDKELAF